MRWPLTASSLDKLIAFQLNAVQRLLWAANDGVAVAECDLGDGMVGLRMEILSIRCNASRWEKRQTFTCSNLKIRWEVFNSWEHFLNEWISISSTALMHSAEISAEERRWSPRSTSNGCVNKVQALDRRNDFGCILGRFDWLWGSAVRTTCNTRKPS